MKSKICDIVSWLILFLLMLLFLFCTVSSIIRVLCDYGLVRSEHKIWLDVGVSLVLSLGIATYAFIGIQKEKQSHIRNLLYMELPNIGLFCVFLIILMSSIDSEVLLSRTEAISIIDISWTIFSISVTIFLVWNVVIFPYLKRHEPVESPKTTLLEKYKYIVKKGSFYVSANRMYSSIVLLTVNLFALASSTCLLYVGSSEIVLLTQFIVKATIILSLNSIIDLFLNILIPIYEEKKELLKNKRVNSTDIDFQNEFNRRLSNAEEIIDELEKNSKLDNEMKVEIMKTLLKGIIDFDSNHDDSV